MLAPGEMCFKVLIQFIDVGNFILAGDSIEIRESSFLMQFLAAGDVLFGFGPLNIIWNMLRCTDLWWVTHCSAWTPTAFKESAHSAMTHSEAKTWPQAQHILTHQKFILSTVRGKPCAPLWVTAISVFDAAF